MSHRLINSSSMCASSLPIVTTSGLLWLITTMNKEGRSKRIRDEGEGEGEGRGGGDIT